MEFINVVEKQIHYKTLIFGQMSTCYLRNKEVVIDVIRQQADFLESGNWTFFNKLEKNMVPTLIILLVSYARFLKQVDVNETTSKFSKLVEIDPNKLTLEIWLLK